MALLRYSDSETSFGYLCLAMLLRLCVFGIGRNIKYYFVFKAKLRQARAEYKRSGTKSVLSIPGYTSLNTLMLVTVVHVVGFFALGAAVSVPIHVNPSAHYSNDLTCLSSLFCRYTMLLWAFL